MSSRTRNRWMGTLLALTAALLLGLPGAAAADDAEVGVVLEKALAENPVTGTLKLDGGVTLKVTERTVMRGLYGERITLADLPSAKKTPHGYEVTGEETIRYEAIRRGQSRVATSITRRAATLD